MKTKSKLINAVYPRLLFSVAFLIVGLVSAGCKAPSSGSSAKMLMVADLYDIVVQKNAKGKPNGGTTAGKIMLTQEGSDDLKLSLTNYSDTKGGTTANPVASDGQTIAFVLKPADVSASSPSSVTFKATVDQGATGGPATTVSGVGVGYGIILKWESGTIKVTMQKGSSYPYVNVYKAWVGSTVKDYGLGY